MDLAWVIKRPVVTEKSTHSPARPVGDQRRYSFEVDLRARKGQIKKTVERIFKVNVEDIKTAILKGKNRKRKKATIQLKEDQKIDIFETGE